MPSRTLQVPSNQFARTLHLVTVTLLLSLPSGQALAFKILEPAEQAVLQSGQTVTVKVDLGNDPGVVQVRYYWYGELDEALVQEDQTTSSGAIVASAALISRAQNDPPFGGTLTVPQDAIGPLRLLAVGDISRGRLGGHSTFDEILLAIEPAATLTAIEFETEKPWRLGRGHQEAGYGQVDTLGKIFEPPVVGLFSDGVARSIRSPSTGTSYRSSNDKVIKVHQREGLLQVVGNGRTTLTATNRGKHAALEVEVEVNEEPNEPPIAEAGPNRTVKAGTKVELNGLKSRDPEGEALYYAWSQIRGNKVSLLDVNMPKASFVAPQLSEPRLYRFKLRVTDKKGADSLPAFVDVIVEP